MYKRTRIQHNASTLPCLRTLLLAALCLCAALATVAGLAQTPAGGTLSPANPVINFTGGPYNVSNPVATAQTPPICTAANCAQFALSIAIPADDSNTYRVSVNVGWTNSGSTTQLNDASDFDLYIYRPDLTGSEVARAATADNPEVISFAAANGNYTIYVAPYDVSPTVPFNATVTLVRLAQTTVSPTPTPTPTPMLPPGTPRFYNYQAPAGVADDAGEPSIGVNWKSEKIFNGVPNGGTVNYFGGFLPYMLRATFNDSAVPAKVTWEKAALTVATAPRVYGDPILFTDHETGRTFVSQEMGLTPAGSTMEWTDDDGRTFLPSEGSGAPSGIDHQTVGGGPYHQPLPAGVNPVYPNGVWYCSQAIADAVCSLSLDGGMTFGPAVPMYSLVDCGGIHGHIKIGPDGTAYVPNVGCGDNQALVVSEDNGLTWTIRKLPQSTAADRDPSVGVGTDGGVYFAYQAADGHSHVAVSHDKGRSWEHDTDIGAPLGVRNSLFHATVAGDAGRAAVAFFGTETGGANYAQPDFPGVWYLYIATTFDGGQTWTTQNATPNDPIQRGGICTDGGCRNLLDFFDATIDKEGRVLVGYDDGCISNACITGRRSYGLPAGNDYTAKAVIARQIGGRRMFAAYDSSVGADFNPPAPPLPPAAQLSCDGNVATDSTDDVINPVLSAASGDGQGDITALSFSLSPDKQSLVTHVTLKNFSAVPVPGTLGAFYNVVWTSVRRNADGTYGVKTFATQVTTDLTGVTYRYGQYDPAENAFVGSTTTTTGATTQGPNGTLSVNVPLSALGNPTIPVTDASALPAVIEPYALVFVHEKVVRFLAPADRAPDYGYAGANWAVCPAPVVTSVEDDDASISYSEGWHLVNDAGASAGHFRMHSGKSPTHSAALAINVPAGRTGKLTYYYATSPKGGTAEVFLDGVARGALNYNGAQGSTRSPGFAVVPFVVADIAAGQHTFELRNMSDTVYVDRFSLESSMSNGRPTSGPGQTSTTSATAGTGQTLTNTLGVGTGATAVAVVAEASNNLPIRLVLVDPAGLTVQTADNSTGGLAVINAPVAQTGLYTVKVVNLSAGSVQVWTAATPTVRR